MLGRIAAVHAASATTRLRPSRLARYSAWSARLSTAAASSPVASAAKPIEIVTSTLRLSFETRNGSVAIRRRNRSATMPATVAQVAHSFVGRPYLEASLEVLPSREGAPEPLICRLDAFDCVTLVENSVAIAQFQLCTELTTLLFSEEEAELLRRRGRAASAAA